ncbi:MAG TPA: phage holin family protein [Pirellulales bacterium]
MASQTSLGSSSRFAANGANGNGQAKKPQPDTATVGAVTSYFTDLAYDLITLTELQARLLLIDVREALTRSALTIVGLTAMAALALASVPVVLFGLAELIVEWAAWSRPAAYLTVGGVTLILALAVGAWTARRLSRIAIVFSRTSQELQDNLEFVKSLLEKKPED